jgi:phosphoenolpyruvate---glycerone phosphotransferase subunit DhaK
MKKLINSPEEAVRQSLEGMALAYADKLRVHYEPNYIYRAGAPVKGKAAIISGGGSGHEPMHNGYVGLGMLDAACPGEIFTSPTPDQMLEAAKTVHSGAGILFLVNNYSGDVMNFEMAGELVRAEGIRVATVLIDDDVAVKNSLFTQGRRGVGTSILAEKILGAAAEQGFGLEQLAVLGRRLTQGGRSMGIALTSCTVPARGKPTFELGDREAEFGIGVHGEPGRERIAMENADEITRRLALSIIEDKEYTRTLREWSEKQGAWMDVEFTSAPFKTGDRVLAFVNNMGGTPVSELYIIYRQLAEICAQRGLTIVRNLIGAYMTSLEMQGCSITLLKMDDELVGLWDAPVDTPALRWGI